MLKIGNRVKVIDQGEGYTTYDEWLMEHAKEYRSRWGSGAGVVQGGTYTVLVIAPHGSRNYYEAQKKLCLIENSVGAVFIVGMVGLKKTWFRVDHTNKHRARYYNRQDILYDMKGHWCNACNGIKHPCYNCIYHSMFVPRFKIKKNIIRKWAK